MMRFLILAASLVSAAPRVAWQNKFGGNGKDRVTAAATDRDGNFLLLGETTSRDFPATALQTRPGGAGLVADGKPDDIPLSSGVEEIRFHTQKLNPPALLAPAGLLHTVHPA